MSEPAFDPGSISYVEAMETVRDAHPKPMSRATGKVLARLDKHCRTILQHATFCVIGTHGPDGADVSPRGDPAGFVRVLGDRHLLLPDRIGNNRFDSYANIFANPSIGMLFLVPGMAEVLRINGLARVTNDARPAGGIGRAGARTQVRPADRGARGLPALRQGRQSRRRCGIPPSTSTGR